MHAETAGVSVIVKIIVLAVLIVLSAYDIKCHEVPVWLIFLGFFADILGIAQDSLWFDKNIFWSCIPGMTLIVAHFIMKNHIGLGDGLVLLMSEMCFDEVNSYMAFVIAIISLMVVALIYLIIFKNKESEIPFVPFITAGVVLVEIIGAI